MIYHAKREFFQQRLLDEQKNTVCLIKHHEGYYDILDSNDHKLATVLQESDIEAMVLVGDTVSHATITLNETHALFHPARARLLTLEYQGKTYHIGQTEHREYIIYENLKKIGLIDHMVHRTVDLAIDGVCETLIAILYVLALTMLHEEDTFIV